MPSAWWGYEIRKPRCRRCDCGHAFVRETLPDRDVNPGESPYQWRRAPEHDT